jgi:phospholipid transport system transporter-binding protein
VAGATFPVEITLDNAPDALEAARAAVRAAPAAGVDLAPLRHFDSTAVAVLVALRREAGSALSLRNPPANLRTLAALYGVEAALFGSGA